MIAAARDAKAAATNEANAPTNEANAPTNEANAPTIGATTPTMVLLEMIAAVRDAKAAATNEANAPTNEANAPTIEAGAPTNEANEPRRPGPRPYWAGPVAVLALLVLLGGAAIAAVVSGARAALAPARPPVAIVGTATRATGAPTPVGRPLRGTRIAPRDRLSLGVDDRHASPRGVG
jgi:hypothetical protein